MKSWTMSFEGKKKAATSTRMRKKQEEECCEKAEITFFKPVLNSLDELALFMVGELFFYKKHGVMLSLVC